MKEIIKQMILDFQKQNIENFIRRDFDFYRIEKKADIFIGVRRCGKSTLMTQIMSDLIKNGVKRENILFMNFFDDRIAELRKIGPAVVTDVYFSLFPEKKGVEKIYCFFDEIQETANWEMFVERILRTELCEIYITGSSAKMLSSEIATQMRGRSLSYELFPFSFKEFLSFKSIP
ncbi:MAG TPA: AAA family ATPase, partial [bacterium]|nr:AAA family ATPase [bacterium]